MNFKWNIRMNKLFGQHQDFALFKCHIQKFSAQLPVGWSENIREFAINNLKKKSLVPTSVTSREANCELEIPVMTVGGTAIKIGLPWLYNLYKTTFLSEAQKLSTDLLYTSRDDRYGVNLNVQIGNKMRYEAHVDSNPIEGILYVTSHEKGSGGELVVAKSGDVLGIDLIRRDCHRIYPKSGDLVFFDARHHSHFVEPLVNEDDIRISVTMNFYTDSCSEVMRPTDLNNHLGIE